MLNKDYDINQSSKLNLIDAASFEAGKAYAR